MSAPSVRRKATATVPLFSLVVLPGRAPAPVFRALVESVLDQRYPEWELLVVDEATVSSSTREIARAYAGADDRIRLTGDAQARAPQAVDEAVDSTRGQFLAFLDCLGFLAPQALQRNAGSARRNPDLDFAYSDEDTVGAGGGHVRLVEKPDWSPERLRGQHYCGQLSIFRSQLVKDLGGFRADLGHAAHHDLALRISEHARRVAHLPEALFHRHPEGPGVQDAASALAADTDLAAEVSLRIVRDHLARMGLTASARPGPVPGVLALRRQLPRERRTSIVVATRGARARVWGYERVLVAEALGVGLAQTQHTEVEVVLVHDHDTPGSVLDAVRAGLEHEVVLVPVAAATPVAERLNRGALSSTGDRLIFLGEDTEARTEGWLEELVAPLEETSVGLTGATLWSSSNTIHTAGLAYAGGRGYRLGLRQPPERKGPGAYLALNRETTAVSTTCAATRREVFLEVGGFCEGVPRTVADLDLSFKIRRAGMRVVTLASAEMFCFSEWDRDDDDLPGWELMRRRWGAPARDRFAPFASPHESERFRVLH